MCSAAAMMWSESRAFTAPPSQVLDLQYGQPAILAGCDLTQADSLVAMHAKPIGSYYKAFTEPEFPPAQEALKVRGGRVGRLLPKEKTYPRGGGRLSVKVSQRKPCLAYATSDTVGGANMGRPENAGSILMRMWNMYDRDHNFKIMKEWKYHRNVRSKNMFLKDFECRQGQLRKRRRLKKQAADEWSNWMKTTGRALGLNQPVIYTGPVQKYTQEELDEYKEIDAQAKKEAPTPDKMDEWKKANRAWYRESGFFWKDSHAGQWPDKMDPWRSPFMIWERPLKKYAYDIPAKGKKTYPTYGFGNVM
jgi:hypothetical protein